MVVEVFSGLGVERHSRDIFCSYRYSLRKYRTKMLIKLHLDKHGRLSQAAVWLAVAFSYLTIVGSKKHSCYY